MLWIPTDGGFPVKFLEKQVWYGKIGGGMSIEPTGDVALVNGESHAKIANPMGQKCAAVFSHEPSNFARSIIACLP